MLGPGRILTSLRVKRSGPKRVDAPRLMADPTVMVLDVMLVNKNPPERMFKKVSMVFFRTCHKKSSLLLGKYKKLSARYCGRYPITKKINDQAYELSLPQHIKVHNVFHVNLLKKYVLDENHILEEELPLVTQDDTPNITSSNEPPIQNTMLHGKGRILLLNHSLNSHQGEDTLIF